MALEFAYPASDRGPFRMLACSGLFLVVVANCTRRRSREDAAGKYRAPDLSGWRRVVMAGKMRVAEETSKIGNGGSRVNEQNLRVPSGIS
jgi:hypothetical protein